jgi:hypothetical protein
MYRGTINQFNHVVISNFYGITIATSKAKASSNFLYRAKQQLKLANTAMLTLDSNKIQEIN